MRSRPGLLAISLGSLITGVAAAVAVASSADAPVVLLGTAEDEPLTGRIAAELRVLGIRIEIRVVDGDEQGIDLEVESALREGARAAIRVDAQAGRTEVSVADPVTRHVALRQVLEGPPTAALAPVLAVRTVEFVRATFLGPRNRDASGNGGAGGGRDNKGRGDDQAARAPDGPPQNASGDASVDTGPGTGGPAPEGRGAAPSPPPWLALALDSGVVATPGGLPSQVTVGLIARLRLTTVIGVEVMGFTPLTSSRLRGLEGTTPTSTWLGGAGLFARQPLGASAGIELGGGVMVALLQTSGTGVDGLTDWGFGGSVYGRLGADIALSRALALRLDLLGGGAFRQIDVVIDGVNRPAWSRSFAAALGGVEARWF